MAHVVAGPRHGCLPCSRGSIPPCVAIWARRPTGGCGFRIAAIRVRSPSSPRHLHSSPSSKARGCNPRIPRCNSERVLSPVRATRTSHFASALGLRLRFPKSKEVVQLHPVARNNAAWTVVHAEVFRYRRRPTRPSWAPAVVPCGPSESLRGAPRPRRR
jgi:hypothetical protein